MGLLQLLAGAGNLLDLPGSMVRDMLALQNPVDQLLTPFSHENRTTGRDLLRKYGMAGSEDNWGNFAGGMAAEVLTDPLTYLGGTIAKRLLRGGKTAGIADAPARTALAESLPVVPPTTSLPGKAIYNRPRGNFLPELPPSAAPTPPTVNPITPKSIPPSNLGVMQRMLPNPPPPQVGGLNRWFYSRLERAAESQLPAGRPVKSQSVLNMLRKAPEGISNEEVALTGLEGFLKGRQTVTRGEVLDHLKRNSVKSQIDRWSYGSPPSGVPSATHRITRYGEYQPIPVSNYQETLFHQPRGAGQYMEPHWGENSWRGMDDAADLASPENVLFHLRSGVAIPNSGQSSYMLHELQSDLHQLGAKSGYTPAETAAIRAKASPKITSLNNEASALSDELQGLIDPRWDRHLSHRASIDRSLTGRINVIRKEMSDTYRNSPSDTLAQVDAMNARLDALKSQAFRLEKRRQRLYTSHADRAQRSMFKGNEQRIEQIRNRQGEIDDAIGEIRDRLPSSYHDLNYPNAPFANSWRTVGARQAMLDAMDQNAARVIVPPGDQVQSVVGGALSGQKRFYDELLPSEFDKIAESVGSPSRMRPYQVTHPRTNAQIPAKAIDLADIVARIRRRGGLPLLSAAPLAATAGYGMYGGGQ